jgi:DNA-binding CsgD family transcriptional regulator
MSVVSLAELTRFSKLIELVYEGATEPARWDVILPAMADWVDAPRGWLFTPMHIPENGGFSFTHGFAPSMIRMWRDKWHTQDLWAFRALELGKFVEGNVMRGDELIPEREIVSTEVYKEFMLPHKMHHLLGGVVFSNSSVGLMPAVCSFFRGPGETGFNGDDSSKMNLLVPHVSRALGVMQRLRDADLKIAASLAALDKVSVGVLLIGSAESVVFANRAARRVLQMEDGLRLRAAAQGKPFLAANASDAQQAITAAIKQCTNANTVAVSHFSNAVSVSRPSGAAAYTLNFSALPEQNEFGTGADRPCAIGFLNDPDAPVSVDAEVLKRLYGLTAAECRLAAHLCDGEALPVIAKRLKVSESTVKTQLQSIFEKTQTRRQVQLVKLLVSLASAAG